MIDFMTINLCAKDNYLAGLFALDYYHKMKSTRWHGYAACFIRIRLLARPLPHICACFGQVLSCRMFVFYRNEDRTTCYLLKFRIVTGI